MANFLRLLLAVMLLPACWGTGWALFLAIAAAANAAGHFSSATLSLLAGMAIFVPCWLFLPRPVKIYVLGHELTHALWGLLFGAMPSRIRVGANGGSVNLTKSNILITLAPYFFPFYVFLIAMVAVPVALFAKRLMYLPVWMFLVGFAWAFHIAFTVSVLAQRQSDVQTYGRVFSWVFIFLANVAIVLLALVAMTPLAFSALAEILANSIAAAYRAVFSFAVSGLKML